MASTAALAQPPDLSDFDTYRLAQDYMLYLINQERSRAGLKRVRLDALASQAAKLHAEDMLKGGYLSHWNMEGLKPARRYNLLGGIDGLGENVFYTSGRLGTMHELIDEAMDTLMSSEGHRLTILGASYTTWGWASPWARRSARSTPPRNSSRASAVNTTARFMPGWAGRSSFPGALIATSTPWNT